MKKLLGYAVWAVMGLSVVLRLPAQTPGPGRVIVADQQPGNDIGAKIAAADLALGSAPGQIQVKQPGSISTHITLSQNHDLLCLNDGITLTLSSADASIRQQSNTRIRNCRLASGQASSPPNGGEIFARGVSNISVENVTFVGGGNHIFYNTVSNFQIVKTRHLSITAVSGSPIFILSSDHGRIVSPEIRGFTEPQGSRGVRMIWISKSSFVEVSDPVIRDIDATTAAGCAGVSFSSSAHSSLQGGTITNLNDCDGVLTEAIDLTPASDIEITGTVATGMNPAAGAGTNKGNGEGFDVFNSKRIRLSNIVSRNNGKFNGNQQPGVEICNSVDVSVTNCDCNENGLEGIRVDGGLAVKIAGSRTNGNGTAGIIVEPVFGNVQATHGSPLITWTPGRANEHFASVWPPNTKIIIEHAVYSIASLEDRSSLTLTNNFTGPSGTYPFDVNSYAEIEGGESSNNGRLGGPAGTREGVYFASDNSSGQFLGRVLRLRATDTQSSKTQMYGVRVENSGRIAAEGNSMEGNAMGTIRDSPGKSSIKP